MNTVNEVTNNNQVENQNKKRGRPRRQEAMVVAGDVIIDSLMSECGLLGVDSVKVSVEGARDVKVLDVLSEEEERGVMLSEEVMSREVYRRERDLAKKAEKEAKKLELKEAKKLEREAMKEKKAADKAKAREDAKALREEAKALKKAEKEKAKEDAKAACEEAKALKKAEKEAARDAAKAEKVAAKEAAKAAKVAAKEAAKAAKKAEKDAAKAEKAATKKNKSVSKSKKTVAPELIAAVNAASESASQCEENGELVPQEFLTETESGDKEMVPMMRQPSTGYESPLRSGDSFCDP